MKHWHPATRLLVFLGVPLLLLAWFLPGADPAVISPVDRAVLEERAKLLIDPLSDATVPAADTLAATVERPLFSPSRRPPFEAPPVEIAPAQPPPPLPVPSLRGILMVRGAPLALLEGTSGSTVRVRQGDTIDGWTVRSITRGQVALEAETDRTVLSMFPKREER